MSVFTYYCRNKLYGRLLGMDTFSKPNTYIGLSTTDPFGSPTEPAGLDYNRVPFSRWEIVGHRKVQNHTTVSFYTRSNWGVIGWFTVWDAIEEGNLIGYGLLDHPLTVVSGKVLSFSRNQLGLQFEHGTITDYLANRFLEHIFGVSELYPITSYVGLSYVNPEDDGDPVVPPYADYHEVDFSSWNVTDISELINVASINFPIPHESWGVIPYVFIKDEEDRVLLYAELQQPILADNFNPVIFNPNDLVFVFD